MLGEGCRCMYIHKMENEHIVGNATLLGPRQHATKHRRAQLCTMGSLFENLLVSLCQLVV